LTARAPLRTSRDAEEVFMSRKQRSVDPGKTPGTAEGGAWDTGPTMDRAGKTPGSAEGLEQGPMGRTKHHQEVGRQQHPRQNPPGHLIDRKAGDPPA
jgi:hypothetical protein